MVWTSHTPCTGLLGDIFALHLTQDLHLQLNILNFIFRSLQIDDLDGNWL